MCGREFSEREQFCSRDGTPLSEASDADPASAHAEYGAAAAQPGSAHDREAVDPLVGSTLDARYRVLRVIGEGGMGVVYEALHVLIEKHVAIKVLRDTFTSRPDVVERFRQEAKSASKIGHPNIVDVSDFGETPSGQSYIVMEMLTGEDLADVLARERVLTPARAVRIAYQVARALHATHNKNIVHRDLKPENIYLVERDGARDVVKIVDFGVAKMNDLEIAPGRKLTRTGMLFGTPEYMSPEQAHGRPFDHRVDIYALGAILFELLAGRVPFVGENFMEILTQHGHSPLPSLRSVNPSIEVSPELEDVVNRALAKDPDQRYQSMGALADELRRVPEMPARSTDSLPPGFWPEPVRVTAAARKPSDPPPLPAASSVFARSAADPQRALFDEAQEAVLLSPGVELSAAQKLGLLAAVMVAGLLAMLLVQRASSAKPVRVHEVAHSAATSGEAPAPIREKPSPEPLAAHSIAVPSAVEPVAPVPAAAPVDELAAAVEQPELVPVHIRTEPSGASVSVLGTALRCDAAPCELSVPRGRAVTLRAETRGGASAERTYTFFAQGAVELRVHAGRGRATSAPNVTSVTSAAGAAGGVGSLSKAPPSRAPSDLKVPSIFRD